MKICLFLETPKKKPEKINPKISETPLVQEFLADTQTSYMEEIVSEKDEEKIKQNAFQKGKNNNLY